MRPEHPEHSQGGIGVLEGGRGYRHGRETVEFSVKGPVGVHINDEQAINSGCAVLDLVFAAPSQVGELTFRNYYTMWLTVLVKTKLSPMDPTTGTNIGSLPTNTPHNKEDTITDWTLSIPKKVLMQYPHQETGSHDLVSISCSESMVEWRNLVALRVVLRQPSPVWRTFHIEEINVYKDMPRRAPKDTVPDSINTLIKRQTVAALRWVPKPEAQGQHSGHIGAYEFTSLPQP